jgi:hypothetical protein
MVPVLARPFPLALAAGSRPLTATRLGSVVVLVTVRAATRAVRPRRGITAIPARPFPLALAAGSGPLTATRIPANLLTAGPLPVTPVTCGGLIPDGLAVAPWTPGWLAIAWRPPASVTFCPAPVLPGGITRGGGTRRWVAGRRPGSGGGPPGTAATGRVGRRVLAAATAGYRGALRRY